MANLLDVSKYDGREIKPDGSFVYHPIDWMQAKTRWIGAIVRASEGLIRDPLYLPQVAAMIAANVPHGAYHAFHPEIDPQQQAQTLWLTVVNAGRPPALGIWLDVELNTAGIPGNIYMGLLENFYDAVRGLASNNVAIIGVYSRRSFIDPLWIAAGKPSWTLAVPGWMANYPYDGSTDFDKYYQAVLAGTTTPPVLESLAFPKLYCHQWTARGKPADVPGYPPYKKAVDLNIWKMPLSDNNQPAPTLLDRVIDLERRVAALEARP